MNNNVLQKFELNLPNQIFSKNPGNFQEKFNRSSFQFTHNLADHPLFDLDRLVQLANFLSTTEGNVRCQVSNVSKASKWSSIPLKSQVLEAIRTIEESGSWVLLYSVHRDPQYAALLERIITELEKETGQQLRQEITWLDAYIFIASPQSVTPYHIDHESTFLFQIHGERDANLFNGDDRSILTEQEIEQYYMGNLEAATYHEHNQEKASVYKLIPGSGVHHPIRAPHWFKNGSSYSVAMGIHFCSKTYDKQAKIYQANHYLRKFGLKSTPPGKSNTKDWIKFFIMNLPSKTNPKNKQELLRSNIHRINFIVTFLDDITKKTRKIPRRLAEKIPIISDFYYYWLFAKNPNLYRGVFKTFSEAQQAIPENFHPGYDFAEAHPHDMEDLVKFNPKDSHLLDWLKTFLSERSTVFDLGGGVGAGYYSYQKQINYPEHLSWLICDVPEAVKKGMELIEKFESPGLSYTSNFMDAEGSEILITCGALQYVEASLAGLVGRLTTKPKHILINRVPLYDGETYITLQNITTSVCPYKIQNKTEFIDSLQILGYELIDSWELERSCVIPFRQDLNVRSYHGFYFKYLKLDNPTN